MGDEHPTADVQVGEASTRRIYRVAVASPLWPEIEVVFDLPALTARDANGDAQLDMFDFPAPTLLAHRRWPAAVVRGGLGPFLIDGARGRG